MSLTKCPDCGHEVSTYAEICPNCGYPLKMKLAKEQGDYPEPLDDSWMNKWKDKPAKDKLVLTLVYLLNLVAIVPFIVFLFVFNETVPYWAIVGAIVFAFISIFTFSIWIAGFICLKSKSVNCDGYNVIAVAGIFHNYLIIEDEIKERVHNRHLDGNLPNGKHVKADFAAWDSSIRISIKDEPYRTSE